MKIAATSLFNTQPEMFKGILDNPDLTQLFVCSSSTYDCFINKCPACRNDKMLIQKFDIN